ncbi:hypothetical protein HAX54_029797 [Datura stramonium]|uniref:Uncharacterized protein n=1 Tax=Datura stramonium TaxID=4076 RepID=A0ABS8V6I1_DATST|nr:hypothetical protein [Datura stramonium]
MRRLEKLSHPNVLPLVAFYYRREEKLLVTDFVDNGSLASHLHGKRDHRFEPLLADYALVPVINKDHAKQFMVAYKSPEYMQNERLPRKILDVSSELSKARKGANADLEVWVNSVVREEWTGDGIFKGSINKIEELKEHDDSHEEDYSSNYPSEGEMYSSKAITDEDFSFSKNA